MSNVDDGQRTGAPGGPGLTVHILRVTLLDVTPPVWRLVRVPSVLSLSELHAVLQVALGWEDRHLHEWRIGDVSYMADDDDDWDDEAQDETTTVLGEVAAADSVLHYDYDLGDGWEHLVEVVDVDPYDGTVAPVAVLDGARAAPPEDCGGPNGYEHLLDALADPDDIEHEELMAWAGEWFDPERFELAQINHQLEAFWRP